MNFINILPSVISTIVAGILAYSGVPNWGWFVVLAIFFIAFVGTDNDETE